MPYKTDQLLTDMWKHALWVWKDSPEFKEIFVSMTPYPGPDSFYPLRYVRMSLAVLWRYGLMDGTPRTLQATGEIMLATKETVRRGILIWLRRFRGSKGMRYGKPFLLSYFPSEKLWKDVYGY